MSTAPCVWFADTSSLAVITDTLQFFNDDFVVPGEQSGGFVDFIRICDLGDCPECFDSARAGVVGADDRRLCDEGAAMRRRTAITA